MARLSSKALPLSLIAAALVGACMLLGGERQQETFLTPSLRGKAVAGLAAALVTASSLSGVAPAVAKEKTYSLFGLGGGSSQSDPYNQIDDDAVSPYSQFSNPKDAIFDKSGEVYVQRKKSDLAESFKRLDSIPALISQKRSEDIKGTLTSQLYMMRQNMEYLSGDEGSEQFKKARDFFQDVSELGVQASRKNWPQASEYHSSAMKKLDDWKSAVSY